MGAAPRLIAPSNAGWGEANQDRAPVRRGRTKRRNRCGNAVSSSPDVAQLTVVRSGSPCVAATTDAAPARMTPRPPTARYAVSFVLALQDAASQSRTRPQGRPVQRPLHGSHRSGRSRQRRAHPPLEERGRRGADRGGGRTRRFAGHRRSAATMPGGAVGDRHRGWTCGRSCRCSRITARSSG